MMIETQVETVGESAKVAGGAHAEPERIVRTRVTTETSPAVDMQSVPRQCCHRALHMLAWV